MRPYDVLFEQALTRVDPERIHHAAFRAIRAAAPVTTRAVRVPSAPVHALGLTFPHPLGLAAGFDKNAVGIDGLAALGFGHVEIGTVTGEAQPGNPQPRLFRLTDDRAIVNRMGFNNDGAEVVARRLAARARGRQHQVKEQEGATSFLGGPILGVNIGKTKVVPEDEAARDYEKSAGLLAPFADYLVVNVSSPNTPGLRDLQAVEKLEPILRGRTPSRRRGASRPPGAAAGQDRPRPQRRRRARRGRPRARHRARRRDRHQHDHQPRRARHTERPGWSRSAPAA